MWAITSHVTRAGEPIHRGPESTDSEIRALFGECARQRGYVPNQCLELHTVNDMLDQPSLCLAYG